MKKATASILEESIHSLRKQLKDTVAAIAAMELTLRGQAKDTFAALPNNRA
jgi:hypothetical protein